jgi:hypothetical protein
MEIDARRISMKYLFSFARCLANEVLLIQVFPHSTCECLTIRRRCSEPDAGRNIVAYPDFKFGRSVKIPADASGRFP